MFEKCRVRRRRRRRRPSVFREPHLPKQRKWVFYSIFNYVSYASMFSEIFSMVTTCYFLYDKAFNLFNVLQAWKYLLKHEYESYLRKWMLKCTYMTKWNDCDKGWTRPSVWMLVGMIPCPWVEVLRAGKGLVVRLVTHGTFKGISRYHLVLSWLK